MQKPALRQKPAALWVASAAFAMSTMPALSAHAADVNWTGATSTEWFTTTNWSTGALPTASDNVHINNNSSPYSALIDTFNTAVANTLYIGETGFTGLLGITGTTVTLTTAEAHIGDGGTGAFITDIASIWNNTGDVYVGEGAAGSGGLQIADESVVTITGTLYIAHDAGSTGEVVIGASDGNTAIEDGSLTAGAVVFGDGDGTLLFNHTSTGYEFDTPISSANAGDGTIDIAAGVTLFGGDDSGFSGTTNINGGTLYINNTTLGGTMNVNSGVLTGYGTLTGAVSVASGAALSPTVGETLTVDNDVTLASGAIYQAQVGTSSAGLLHATGVVNVASGATLTVVGSGNADDYGYTSTYSIITADGGVNGTFASIANNNLPFLDAVLSYPDADTVTLTVTRNSDWLVAAAQTQNQKSVASAVETLGVGNAVYDALITASGADARTAYDSMSGEIHASARGEMVEGTRVVRDALMERMGDAAAEDAVVDDSVVWLKGYGDTGNLGSSGGSASVHHMGAGTLLGIDHPLGADGARIGVATGYGHTSFGENGRSSAADDDSYRAALYGGLPLGGWNIRLASDYAWHALNTSRTATLPGITDHLSANYDAHTWQTFGEAGYPVALGEETTLEPYLGFSHVTATTDAVTEQGGVAALDVKGSGYATNYASLGLHLVTPWYLQDTPITTHTTLAWTHGFFAKSAPTAEESFVSDPQAAFAVTGALGKLSLLKFDFGGDVKLSERSLLRLDGLLQLGGAHDYGVQALFVFKM